MKNYKEISERDIGKIVKKKLTGDQSLGLVQSIKSEPRFTIEASYNNLYLSKRATSSKSLKTDTLGKITAINKSLINTFNSIEKESLTSEEFKKVEFNLKILIENINNFLKKFKTETH